MASSARLTHPLDSLHSLATALEAAVLESLAKPRKKAVHNLRTATRRIQAQLELFASLPNVTLKSKPRDRALDLLRDLRHAAGQVRDLDVQRDLIAEQVASKKHPGSTLRGEARDLRKTLKQRRQKSAEALVELLEKRRDKIPIILKHLFDSLPSGDTPTVTEPQLIKLVREWYAGHCRQQTSAPILEDTARLHDIRKKAKVARYLAESSPNAATRAHRLAARYEDLQQAGGNWHDFLLLAQLTANELGKSSKLAARFNTCAARSLKIYKRKLKKKI